MFNPFPRKPALTAEAAVQAHARREVIILDVRDASELTASGTAAGGLHIPLAAVPLKAAPHAPDRPDGLHHDLPVAVFCAVGGRAGRAVEVLRAMGYDAHNIGGFSDWVAAGGPVSR